MTYDTVQLGVLGALGAGRDSRLRRSMFIFVETAVFAHQTCRMNFEDLPEAELPDPDVKRLEAMSRLRGAMDFRFKDESSAAILAYLTDTLDMNSIFRRNSVRALSSWTCSAARAGRTGRPTRSKTG